MFEITHEHLLGKPTLHVPMNFIVQDMGGGKITGVFQTSDGESLKWGSNLTHQLILGDVFIRPRLVAESNHLIGVGISGLARDGFASDSIEQWRKNVLFVRK